MIKLYYTTIKNLTGSYKLADWQRKKADAYRKKEDSLRSVAASLLINTVLFDGLPAPAPSLGDYGKPYFSDKPNFNISHASDFAVMAVASLPVGIDIEQIVETDYLSLGHMFACDYEYQLLTQAADKRNLFFKLWTFKESYLKMTGMGFHQDPKSVCVLAEPPGCNFFVRRLSDGYATAICSADTVCEQDFVLLNF